MDKLLEDLAEVALLAEKATPGEWSRDYDNDTGPNDDYYVEWETAGPAKLSGKNGQADADYIAALHRLYRTHHAEIAEAVRDARRYQDMRIALYQENITVGEAELVLHVYGACPSIEQFDASIDAHNSAREGE